MWIRNQIKGLIGEIQGWFENMQRHASNEALAKQVDWERISDTRSRLVQMRFKNGQPHDINPDKFNSIDMRPNTELSQALSLNGLNVSRASDRSQITHWMKREESKPAASTGEFEKHLRDVIYRRDRQPDYFVDNDVSYTAGNTATSTEIFDPLLLPKVNYEPAAQGQEQAPAGYIGMTQSSNVHTEQTSQ